MLDKELSSLYDRRSAMVLSAGVILTSFIVLRLVHLQVFEHKKYKKLADNNYLRIKAILPERGKIIDQNGIILATNKSTYRAYIIPKEAIDKNTNPEDVVNIISKELKLSDKEIEKIKKQMNDQRKFIPTLIQENLSWKQMASIQSLQQELPGLHIESGWTRLYPFETCAAHVLGYVGDVSDGDLKRRFHPMMEIPYFKTGKYGIERRYDPILRGVAGRNIYTVDAIGRTVEDFSDEAVLPESGTDIQITINKNIQDVLEKALAKHNSGSGVVVDIETGGVLAMASYPSFNPKTLQEKGSDAHFRDLVNNPYKPFINKTIEGAYPPGSTFKIIVALAGLESGAILPEEKIYCEGFWQYGNQKFHCWKKEGHGWQNLYDALAHSCDIYFYQMSRRIGIDAIKNMALKLGLGNTLQTDLLGEHPGLIPDKRWKEKNIGQKWLQSDTILSSIGQGYILTTPLQLAIMTARAVSGKEVFPTLIVDQKNTSEFNSLGISQKSLDIVIEGMKRVCEEGGTAYWSSINVNGLKMGGKTGTAQVRRISMSERDTGIRKDSELPFNLRNHALFVGFAPIEKPKYAISIVMEHGGGGSSVSGPIAAEVMRATLKEDLK